MQSNRKHANTTSASARSSNRKSTARTSQDPPLDPDGPIYFWKPQEPTTGYLGQWYSLPFRDASDPPNGKIYKTAEHYMMHHKALLFKDEEIGAQILRADDPKTVKALGRQVKGFDDKIWQEERMRIVTEGNWCKFSSPVLDAVQGGDGAEEQEKETVRREVTKTDDSPAMHVFRLGICDSAETVCALSFRDVLLATGDRELVEASPMDRIWGIGFGAQDAPKCRERWGLNLLGKCLMDVREQFRKEDEARVPTIEEEKENDG
ncbi:hypothetical protein F5Y18DRAFT_165128 [Xylariaceae sp. FL1019]|nr:hypothetical protein F5Y18DRAFT_165128 [Xylariaceae sp. FL1019]